jgi:hypothetical protein
VLPLGGWTGVGVWCLALSPLDGGRARVERAAAAEPARGTRAAGRLSVPGVTRAGGAR